MCTIRTCAEDTTFVIWVVWLLGASPILNLFITLLSIGSTRFTELLEARQEAFQALHNGLVRLSSKLDMSVLETPRNDISIAFTFRGLDTALGSQMFSRGVSGTR